MVSVTRNATATRRVLRHEKGVDVERYAEPPDALGRCGADIGGEFTDHRAQVQAAILLHFGKMVAVDDGERIDPPLDRRIGGDRVFTRRPARVEIDEAGDHLQVVLDAMVDLTRQLGLAHHAFGEARFMLRHGRADRAEGVAEIAKSPAPAERETRPDR